MPINISQSLTNKLPESERPDIKEKLWQKSSGHCFLCDGEFVESTDDIVADHNVPDAEGGPTKIDNLNLAHSHCNSFKRNHPTADVRPFLKLSRQIHEKGGFLKYDEAMALMGTTISPIDLVDEGNQIIVKAATLPKATYPVFEEDNKEGKFRFTFADLPRECIYNDDKCQPRTIKLQHLWSIYNDISRNPLHEAPACRMSDVKDSIKSKKALLFDGQHKSLAFWLSGRKSVVTKIYLDITKDAAVRLVNSVQAKIKKLPLSPFELSAKMAEEWQERVSKYEEQVGSSDGSEDGFLKWVEKDERTRAKSAFVDALYENIISDESLAFRQMILKPGEKKSGEVPKVTEAGFKNRVLKALLHTAPLSEKFDASRILREREKDTIIRLLNVLYDKAFVPQNGSDFTVQEATRAKRLVYQSAMQYVAKLMRRLYAHRLVTEAPREILDKTASHETWSQIEQDIGRLLAHPIWTADLDTSDKTKAVSIALSKNQDADRVFADVELKLGYVVGADEIGEDCVY